MRQWINRGRRQIIGTGALAAAQSGLIGPASAQPANSRGALPVEAPRTARSFGPLKEIEVGALSVGYTEAGPAAGPLAILLHGWPYDIHSFVDIAPLLAEAGYRVIVPFLRGYGTTQFLSGDTASNRHWLLTSSLSWTPSRSSRR